MGIKSLNKLWETYREQIVAFLIASLVLQTNYILNPDITIDGSWIRAINMAIHNNLVFGKDFIFTYGPLGFLDTRNSEYLNKIIFLFFDAFLFWGYYRLFKSYISENKKISLLLLLCMVFMRFFTVYSYATKLFLIYIFFIIRNYKSNYKNYTDLVYISLACVILFFEKINYGLFAVVLLCTLLIVCLFEKRKQFLILSMVSLASFYICLLFFHVDVINYVKFSLPLIANYNDAMYLPIELTDKIFLLAVLDVLFFVIIILLSFFRKNASQNLKANGLGYLLCTFFLYLLFKNGFVRADYHMSTFFYCFPLFLLLVISELKLLIKKYSRWLIVLALAVTSLAFPVFQYGTLQPYNYLVEILVPYAGSLTGDTQNMPNDEQMYLSETILHEIKDKTVDILPWDIAIADLNHLNYKPRPIPQSYSAYSKQLDSINAAFISSVNKPCYLIITNKTIDNRYPFWDESITKQAIRLNYHFVSAFKLCTQNEQKNGTGRATHSDSGNIPLSAFLLLKANEPNTVRTPLLKKLNEFNWGEAIKINCPDSIPVYMTLSANYSMIGKIRRIFFQPPPLKICLTYDDGTKNVFRCIYSLLNTPFLINKTVVGNTELRNFLSGNLKKNKKITGIQIVKEGGWCENLKVSLYKMQNYLIVE